MVDRPACVVAQLCGQAGRSSSRPVSANIPQICLAKLQDFGIAGPTCRFATAKRCGRWAGHVSARIKGDRLGRTWGMPVANRLCPDENLLRQNASI
ncbi:hypothetical protein HJC00_30345 [Rhizobium sp. NLR22b]|nr:hypothetical protein [Rhizobium sp. NLR22b]